MWTIILTVLFGIFGIVFLLSAIIMSKNLSRMRTQKGRTLLKRRRRNTVLLTLVSFAAAIGMALIGFLPGYYQGALAGDVGYDLAGTYKSVLDTSSTQKAYLYLPVSVCADDGQISLKNERGEWFVYEQTENSEGERSYRWVNRGKKTVKYQTLQLGDETMMNLQLGLDGRLYAEGTFPYMTYDHVAKEYSGKLEDGVSNFFCRGNTLFFLTDEQKLYALGLNTYGQMGDASNKNKTSPTFIRNDIVEVATSQTHTMMVDIFGNLYATGDNSDSGLGDGTMNDVNAPMKIMGGVDSVAVGNYFSVILAQNGEVYTCGRNDNGQCGNGTKNGTATPHKIAEGAIKVVASDAGAAYMTEEGKVYAWGTNKHHQLSTDSVAFFDVPTLVAQNAYDIAISPKGLVILDRERNVLVTGALRDDKAKLTQTILSMGAEVPEEYVSPVEKEEKPDISELGKDE